MTRRTTLSMLVALFAMMLAITAGTSTASAQCPINCQCPVDCTFLVNVSCAIPPHCFPINLTTAWTNAAIGPVVQNNLVPACGGTFFPQPAPCLPISRLDWASLDGGLTMALPNGPPVRYILPCGIPVCLSVVIGPMGCFNVNIVPC